MFVFCRRVTGGACLMSQEWGRSSSKARSLLSFGSATVAVRPPGSIQTLPPLAFRITQLDDHSVGLGDRLMQHRLRRATRSILPRRGSFTDRMFSLSVELRRAASECARKIGCPPCSIRSSRNQHTHAILKSVCSTWCTVRDRAAIVALTRARPAIVRGLRVCVRMAESAAARARGATREAAGSRGATGHRRPPLRPFEELVSAAIAALIGAGRRGQAAATTDRGGQSLGHWWWRC